jgi:hypothetical protein
LNSISDRVNTRAKEISMLENQETQPGSLSLNDIANMIQLITVVTERGAIKPGEMSAVGELYDRLVSFIRSAGVEVTEGDSTSKEQQ